MNLSPQSPRRLFGFARKNARKRIQAASARCRPGVEYLEDRFAPALLTVNTLADNDSADNFLSLREAIALVHSGGDANAALGRSLTAGEANQVNALEAFGSD